MLCRTVTLQLHIGQALLSQNSAAMLWLASNAHTLQRQDNLGCSAGVHVCSMLMQAIADAAIPCFLY